MVALGRHKRRAYEMYLVKTILPRCNLPEFLWFHAEAALETHLLAMAPHPLAHLPGLSCVHRPWSLVEGSQRRVRIGRAYELRRQTPLAAGPRPMGKRAIDVITPSPTCSGGRLPARSSREEAEMQLVG